MVIYYCLDVIWWGCTYLKGWFLPRFGVQSLLHASQPPVSRSIGGLPFALRIELPHLPDSIFTTPSAVHYSPIPCYFVGLIQDPSLMYYASPGPEPAINHA